MRLRTTLLACALAAGTALSAGSAPAEDLRVTVTAGHPPVFLWVKELQDYFIPEVDRRLAAGGEHSIEWTQAYGGTVAKIGGELDAIRDGISDMGIVGTIFQASDLPLQNVSYFAPFGTSDLKQVTRIIAELQETIPAMGEAWTDNDQVYLAGAALDTYHLFTNFPVTSVDDLAGKRIMAPGPSANWINGTGAVAVASALPEYYNNIQTGVADGVVTFATGAWPIKLWEVAPHITPVDFGAMYAVALTVNRDVWEGFPEEVRTVMREVAQEYADRVATEQARRADDFLRRMVSEHGATLHEFPAAERAKWAEKIVNPAQAWVESLEAKGLPALEVLEGYLRAQERAGTTLVRDWAADLRK
ncbi:C4-dicarboxylate TRAP transporter substrate-binding protein [Arenibaculum sp.]|jgi:TRAP-type C4-dicarboxylate transport system substrate-binding protein|uniref:C4-dicarboxylate TRAP transporter substrate-binding protein n=1 Tax=Arenibaculum sp. TaxID=2865862 RepID=UPI002E0DA9FC|nr:C4-dicarboxylate TRAP transporter substrate-binding protein [Arenibaculum sp.]